MRYLPLTETDRKEMLSVIGVATVDALFCDVPEAARLDAPVDLPSHASEMEVEQTITALALKNLSPGCAPSFLGAGIYRHHVPASVDHLIQRSEFMTAYTPYQPEISQGTLQYLFEFQTQVAMLTDMDVANASMYDGATSCAEAVFMAGRVTRRKKALLSGGLHPHYRGVTATSASLIGFSLETAAIDWAGTEDLSDQIDDATACVVVQNPDVFGRVRDYSALAEACQAKKALLVVVVTEPISFGLITPPGAMGADIVVAEGQGLGNGASYGGPTVGLMATRHKYVRQMPGRLVGETTDVDGKRGYVLTLSTREQHIRREKATSNICTNSGLCALAFSIHLTLLGEIGMKQLAALNHARAVTLAGKLSAVPGVEVLNDTFFNEFTVRLPKSATDVVEDLAAKYILGGVPASRIYPGVSELDNLLLITATEMVSEADMDRLVSALKEVL